MCRVLFGFLVSVLICEHVNQPKKTWDLQWTVACKYTELERVHAGKLLAGAFCVLAGYRVVPMVWHMAESRLGRQVSSLMQRFQLGH